MEVHHHPDLHHKAKPWKEYLLEGLMIFVAVTMGFFAESLREHINDRDKEQKYIIALKAELKGDTANYEHSIKQILDLRPLIDSLFLNASEPAQYNYIIKGKWNTPINETTTIYFPGLAIIQQLKGSGNLRLVDREDIGSKIIGYETYINGRYKQVYTALIEAQGKLFSLEDDLCDYTDFNNWLNKDMLAGTDPNKRARQFYYDMPVKVRDLIKLNQLANSAVNYNGWNAGFIRTLKNAKEQATELIEEINKEYDFK
ncbi:MAG TPA: hypothetical protein VG367_17250 [Mucilaginibacter sp.]|jgi:hypothetical protein|nr:hypothetical protein [Mucilaginibacter sp.]